MPYPHEYIYLNSYGMDSICCTGLVRVMGYKYLLLDDHTVTALLVCRRGGGRGDENDRYHHVTNTNGGGWGYEQRR